MSNTKQQHTINHIEYQKIRTQIDLIRGMLNQHARHEIISDELYHLEDMLQKSCAQNTEILTSPKMKELFGVKYDKILYYNFDSKSWNTTTYAGTKMSGPDVAATPAMMRLKEFLDKRLAPTNTELVACVIMAIGYGYHGLGEPIINPTYNQYGKYIAGTVVLRNKDNGKIMPLPKSWIGGGTYINQSGIGSVGAQNFAEYICNIPVVQNNLISALTSHQK